MAANSIVRARIDGRIKADAEQLADFALSEALGFEDSIDMKSQLSPSKKLIGILETQIRKNVPRAFFKFDLSRRCDPLCRFFLKSMTNKDSLSVLL